MSQIASEFWSLGTVIIRLWLEELKILPADMAADIIRFNESIDEAVKDSTEAFSANG